MAAAAATAGIDAAVVVVMDEKTSPDIVGLDTAVENGYRPSVAGCCNCMVIDRSEKPSDWMVD